MDRSAGLSPAARELREQQYSTSANLAARQSIYAYQDPKIALPGEVLGLAELEGYETIVDVGCGNGRYLEWLSRHGHSGRMLGVDFSTGMLRDARRCVPAADVIGGDAAAIPLRDRCSDLTLAASMLHHVDDPAAAIGELLPRRAG